jgi:hypothetical protein
VRWKQVRGDVAVVSATPASARSAAAALAPEFPSARLLPLSLAQYRARRGVPLPAILAPAGADRASDRRFLEAARARILWKPAPQDLYAAIAGVLTDLPERHDREGAPDFQKHQHKHKHKHEHRHKHKHEPVSALLLEGAITPERARAALASPARHWIVEHVGKVRLSGAQLASLSRAGVQWSVLHPARVLAIADRTGCARSLFPRGMRIWRWGGGRQSASALR